VAYLKASGTPSFDMLMWLT